ncbi:hypothetical protein UGMREWDR_CDS0094 [Aeromonas phage GomatiRiver_11]|nr:hypothetical protein OBDJBBDK_00087 [Aeromonas phage AhFM11]WKW84261.1 hypothetical protein UGMREWDR_CDS0094 [Aeromonas phage GomatiRiver_11]
MISLVLAASIYWNVESDYVKYQAPEFTVLVGNLYDAECDGKPNCAKSPKIEIQMFSEFPGDAHIKMQRHRDSYDGIGKMGNSYTVTYRSGIMKIQSSDVAWFYLSNRVSFRNPDNQDVWTIKMDGFQQAYRQMLRNAGK